MKQNDYSVLIICIIISILGLAMIFSTGGLSYFLKQSIWLITGILICLVLSKFSTRFWQTLALPVYILCCLFTILVLFYATGYPRRWIDAGIISFQPSEFAKIGTILFLASYLSERKKMEKFIDFLVPLVIIAIPGFFVFIEPDFGAAQIFFPIMCIMLLWAGMPLAKILIFFSPILSAITSFSIYIWLGFMIIFGIFVYRRKKLTEFLYHIIINPITGLITPLLWHSLKAYQQKRIIAFLSPWIDPKGISWQSIQSKIAIGSGQILGKGFLSGTQKKLEFLPERHTDFIFSCIGEEFGFFGIMITVLLYILLFYRLLRIARETKHKFSSLVVIGILSWFWYQTFINMGMTLGILPITGVPLPFVSYGGSALLACFIAAGIVMSISREKY
ncbi:MAG: rod shape-determining protein RodA [candidate division WOR-3 bacterium]|nr:rod shape-determining protein RodA [candidate division WOR-3 bacterium]